jgi:hypothetical protein
MITFAVNGLIAWAAAFMQRVHGLSVASVGSELTSGRSPAVSAARWSAGDSPIDWQRWPGGRVLASGAGFVLAPRFARYCCSSTICAGSRPLVLATYFFYAWYNGPLVAVILDVSLRRFGHRCWGRLSCSRTSRDALAPPLIGYLSDRTGSLRCHAAPAGRRIVGRRNHFIDSTSVQRDMRRVSASTPPVSGGR